LAAALYPYAESRAPFDLKVYIGGHSQNFPKLINFIILMSFFRKIAQPVGNPLHLAAFLKKKLPFVLHFLLKVVFTKTLTLPAKNAVGVNRP
jgi:hypothetical protein